MAPTTKSVVAQMWAAEASLARERTQFAPADATSEEQVLQSINAALARLRHAVPSSTRQIARSGAASATQEALMHARGPLFIEGRSGTGKTTVISGRIALKHAHAQALLFVTRSSMLRDEVQRTLEGAGVKCGRLPAAAGIPALATWEELLRQISGACSLPQGRCPPVLSFEDFCSRVLPRLKHVSAFGPHLLWGEFISRLSGPVTPSLRAYREEAAGFSATGIRLLPEDFQVILRAFNEYKLFKKKHLIRDDADIAVLLAEKMGARGRALHFDELLVDEVQDFTPGECRLLLALSRSPAGLCFAGDTAQTITNGCGFTFNYLRRLVRERFSGVQPPETVHLGTNYRSTMSIVELGKAQVRLLESFFPGTVDPIEAVAHHKAAGDRPLFLSLPEGACCVDAVQGRLGRLDRASFLVIVRTDLQRQSLRKAGLNATILTVEEAKGLERQVVVVVDFFMGSPAPRAGLLWNFPRAALPAGDDHRYRTKDGESRIAWLLSKQAQPESLGSLSRRERAELYALAPAVLEMKHLYVADTRAAKQLVHVEQGTRLAKHMLDFYAQSGNLVKVVGLEELQGEGVAAHPSVSKCVAAYVGPCIEHVLDVTEKSVELYRHASDDASRTAVFGEAARALKESREELLSMPRDVWRDGWEQLQSGLADGQNLSEGHWHRRFQNDPHKAAQAYLAARVPVLAGEAFAAAGEHLSAAACFLHVDPHSAASQLRLAGELGRGMVVLLSTAGSPAALSQAREYLDARMASPEVEEALLAALQRCFLSPDGASWLVLEQGSQVVIETWFLRALLRSDLELWSEELLEGTPQLASGAFAAAVTVLMCRPGAQALRLLELCRRVAAVIDAGQACAGALSQARESQDHVVAALSVLANALPPLQEYRGARVEAALGALEAFCSSRLRAGAAGLTQQLGECQSWRSAHLPLLDDVQPAASRWPLSSVVLTAPPHQLCAWDAAAGSSWDDDEQSVLCISDQMTEASVPPCGALSDGVARLKRMCECERYSRLHLQQIGKTLPRLIRDLEESWKELGGKWVHDSLPLGEPGQHCPGAMDVVDRLRSICENREGVTYRWYRFVVKRVRDQREDLQRGWQCGEVVLLRRRQPVDLRKCRVSLEGGEAPNNMHSVKVVAGDPEKRKADRIVGSLTMEFDRKTTVDWYTLRTAGDSGSEGQDPASWLLEGSDDGEFFEPLHVTAFDAPCERGAQIGEFPLCAERPAVAVRAVAGGPHGDMAEVLHTETGFLEWIAKEVTPALDSVVTPLCSLIPMADKIDLGAGPASGNVSESLRLIHDAELMRLPQCQEALARALRRALGSDALPCDLDGNTAKGRVPVLNPVLLKALNPSSWSCTLSERHLQQLANRCLVAAGRPDQRS